MARVNDAEFTLLTDQQIASSGIGNSPRAVSAYSDLQQAVYRLLPQDTADVQQAVNDAATAAAVASTAADTAQGRADDAYALADTKVSKDVGPTFAAPSGSASRAALPAYATSTAGAVYTQSDVQGLIDQVAALTSRVAALIVDGRGNHSLTP